MRPEDRLSERKHYVSFSEEEWKFLKGLGMQGPADFKDALFHAIFTSTVINFKSHFVA